MRRWFLRLQVPLALLLLAVAALSVAALALQSSHQAQAGAISSDAVACAADDGALAASVDGVSLASCEAPLLAAKCYVVGVTIFDGGCGMGDLYVLRYLCYDPGRGWYYKNYWWCETVCGSWSRGLNDARTWKRCTEWYCESEWVEWRLSAANDGCRWGQGMSGLDWLSHGTTWFDYFVHDHEVALFPQWSTDVEHGSPEHRVTDSLGGYMPYGPGYGESYGYTTDIYGCHEPGITDDLIEDNCGDVGRAFTSPVFTTTGFMWCYETPGTWCDPSVIRLDVVWSW